MLTWWLSVALAAPCPDLPTLVHEGWDAFHDAEVSTAEARVEAAHAALSCQPAPVATEALLELYRLHTLVALARQDRQGAVYGTIRAVAAAPDTPPPESLGPLALDLHATWSARLSPSRAQVWLDGGGEAWVSGQHLPEGALLEVPEGEHLVQWRGPQGIHSEVRELSGPSPLPTELPATRPPPSLPVAQPDPVPLPPPPPPRSGRRTALVVTGVGAAAAGAGALTLGFLQEQAFHGDLYQADAYEGCARGEACYAAAREAAIRADATRIRSLYATGYGLVGVGVVVVGTELLLLPSPTGGSLRLSVTW